MSERINDGLDDGDRPDQLLDLLNQLEFRFRNGSVYDRKQVLDQLAKMPADIAIPLLQKLATSPDFLNRRFAVMGLGNHRTELSFQVLTQLLAKESDENVLSEIANTLFDFGDRAIPLLESLFERNHNWLTRQTIIGILMESDREDVLLRVIRQAIDDPTQTVRETAILAMGKLIKGEFETEILDLLANLANSDFWRDRWRSATSLSISTHPQAKAILAKLKQDENHYVVAAALESDLS